MDRSEYAEFNETFDLGSDVDLNERQDDRATSSEPTLPSSPTSCKAESVKREPFSFTSVAYAQRSVDSAPPMSPSNDDWLLNRRPAPDHHVENPRPSVHSAPHRLSLSALHVVSTDAFTPLKPRHRTEDVPSDEAPRHRGHGRHSRRPERHSRRARTPERVDGATMAGTKKKAGRRRKTQGQGHAPRSPVKPTDSYAPQSHKQAVCACPNCGQRVTDAAKGRHGSPGKKPRHRTTSPQRLRPPSPAALQRLPRGNMFVPGLL
eukprot:gnl/Trimastix_PCT/3891.p1 GENE.gnl/Trimastix_PCT/3891~~gnl/Trimastix_PCT/3891.p1  ORF type:complete len:262 (+),score=3.57 gnl/Trimastix_PCT/3891:41-826(+)